MNDLVDAYFRWLADKMRAKGKLPAKPAPPTEEERRAKTKALERLRRFWNDKRG